MTPSEIHIWGTVWAQVFAAEVDGADEAADPEAAKLATLYANRAVAALRAHRQAHGAWIGARVVEAQDDG